MSKFTITEHGTVDTWADGFGVWHASVPTTDRPQSDAHRARQAIRDEIALRSGPDFDPTRIKVRRTASDKGRTIYTEN